MEQIPMCVLGILLVLLSCLCLGCGALASLNDSDTLINTLMANYNKYSRPIEDQAQALQVSMKLELVTIQEFNEVEESLVTVCSMQVKWQDDHMKWDMADHGYIYSFLMPYKDVWVPECVININPSGELSSFGNPWQLVRYEYTGQATWNAGGTFKTSCSVDVSKYPFDTQTCDILFLPWGYGAVELNLTNSEPTVNFTYYVENGRWSIDGSSAKSESFGGGASRVTYSLKLRRKPLFIVTNTIVPVMFLSFLNCLVFLMPQESGERMSYSLTILLALVVFMTIIADTLPKNSSPMAYIAFMLLSEMLLSGLIAVAVIVDMKLYYKPADEKIPGCIQKLLKTLLRRTSTVTPTETNPNADIIKPSDQVANTTVEEKKMPNIMEDNDEATPDITWVKVSSLMNTVCLITFIALNVTVFLIYFVMVAT